MKTQSEYRSVLKPHVGKRLRFSGQAKMKHISYSKNGNPFITLTVLNVTCPNINKPIDHLNIIVYQNNMTNPDDFIKLCNSSINLNFTGLVDSYMKTDKETYVRIKNYNVKNLSKVEIDSINKPLKKSKKQEKYLRHQRAILRSSLKSTRPTNQTKHLKSK